MIVTTPTMRLGAVSLIAVLLAVEETNAAGSLRTAPQLQSKISDDHPAAVKQDRRELQVPYSVPFDIGALQYSGYYDSSEDHRGNCDVTNPVDAKSVSDSTCNARGGECTVGWTESGEWLRYDFALADATTVDITIRLSSNRSSKQLALDVDNNVLATWNAPGQGFDTFEDRTLGNVSLAAGSHELYIRFINGQINVCSVSVQYSAPAPTTPAPTTLAPTTLAPMVPPTPAPVVPPTPTPVVPPTAAPVLAPTTSHPSSSPLSDVFSESPTVVSSIAPSPTPVGPSTPQPVPDPTPQPQPSPSSAPTITASSSPSIAAPSSSFRLKMYHEPGYWWQCDGVCDQSDITVDVDPRWCLECEGSPTGVCDSGDFALIQTCDTGAAGATNSLFEFVPTASPVQYKIKAVNTNLCLTNNQDYTNLEVRENTNMQTCSDVEGVINNGQLWWTGGIGDFFSDGGNFEIRPAVGPTGYCLTTKHHPLNDEDARIEKCRWAQKDDSSLWVRYNP